MAENYDLIFGQSASSQYAWGDSDYQNGWQTVGSTPPTAEQFDALQRRADLKAQELNNRLALIEENDTHDYRQPNTAYTVGKIAYHASLPTGWCLECTTGGTTSRGELVISSPSIGGTVSDGTVQWQIRKGVTLPYELPEYMETLLDDKDAETARATLGAPSTTGDGASGTWGINISGNAETATTANTAASATKATSATTAAACSGNSATATKLASESGNNYVAIDSEEDSWSVIGSNPGDWLKSIRTNSSAPPYSIGNFSAAVAFGRWDTKGIITHAYDNPFVKFAGGRGSTANWKFTIRGGSNNEVYDLNNFPTKTGGGASGTWGINISGNAASATTASNVSGKIYYSSDSPSVATNKLLVVKQAQNGDDNVPGNGLVIQTGSNESWNGKLYIPHSGSHGVWIGGITDGKKVDWTRLVENHGSWNINSATATNADKLDGAHLADVYRQVGGHNTPTITSIIDWNTMKACNGGTDVRNINNTTYGVKAYGGDSVFSSGVLNGYAKGSFYLTQDYTNFDKLCFLFCSDTGKDIEYTMTDVFLLNYIMTNYSVVNLSHDDDDFWIVTGYSNKGTAKDKVSTKRIFSAPASLDANNCGIVDVLGIKY